MSSWKPFLLALADEFDEPLLLTWEMSNGASFQMLLPRRDEFLESTFSAAIGFGFQFDEIRQVHFEPDLHFAAPRNFDLRVERILAMHPLIEVDASDCGTWSFGLETEPR
jgi:hypothetical protein